MDEDLKVRENRLRRKARRQGLILRKSRLRDPHATLYGSYSLATVSDVQMFPRHKDIATLDEIESYLTKGDKQ